MITMFGRDAEPHSDVGQEIDVDLVMEQDISMVKQAVDNYLQNPNESLRRDLLTALEELDHQLAEGDAYRAKLRFPFGSESSVVGATCDNPVAEELLGTEFQAQVALVKAAKNAVMRLTSENLADLRAASDALGAWPANDQ
jgi:hypothetical protein